MHLHFAWDHKWKSKKAKNLFLICSCQFYIYRIYIIDGFVAHVVALKRAIEPEKIVSVKMAPEKF